MKFKAEPGVNAQNAANPGGIDDSTRHQCGLKSLSAGAYDPVSERVIIFGGLGKGNYSNKKSDAWTFYHSRWEKVEINSIGSRDHHEMIYAEHLNSFVLYGGIDSVRNYDTTTWLLKANRFIPLQIPGPGIRYHFAMSYDPLRKKVILYGGGKEHQRMDRRYVQKN